MRHQFAAEKQRVWALLVGSLVLFFSLALFSTVFLFGAYHEYETTLCTYTVHLRHTLALHTYTSLLHDTRILYTYHTTHVHYRLAPCTKHYTVTLTLYTHTLHLYCGLKLTMYTLTTRLHDTLTL